MVDVASLGIAVDSSQVKAGTDQLRAFESVARRTGETVDQVQKRFAAFNTNTGTAAAQTKAITAAAAPANEQLAKMAVTSDRTNVAIGRLFGLQIGQIAGRAIRDLISYAANLNKSLADTADTAGMVGISFQKFQGLSTAAAYKGVSGDAFNAGMLKFNEQIDLARNGLGSLQGLLRANGKTVGDTATTFNVVSDFVKNAASEAQKFSILQQAGLPATREFVKYMEQGASAITKQSDAARKLTDQQIEDARRVQELWNKGWVDFERWGKSATVSVFDFVKQDTASFFENTKREWAALKGFLTNASRGATGAGSRSGDIDYSPANPAGKVDRGSDLPNIGKAPRDATVDNELSKQKLQQSIQQLTLYGQLTTAEEAWTAVLKQMQLASASNLSVDGERAKKLAQLAYETNLGITQIKAQADAYNVEAQTVGMSTGAGAAYTAVQSKINEQRRLGNELSVEARAALEREAQAMGRAAEAVENTRFQYDTFKSSFVSFGQYIRQGESAWAAFKHAGTDALGKISDKLMSMAADNLWKSAFGGSAGGGLMSLFGMGGGELPGWGSSSFIGPTVNHSGYGPSDPAGPTRYVHPAYFDNAPRFHQGIGPGERPAIIRNDESILTPGQMRQLAPRGAGGVSVHAGDTHITVQGSADKESIALMQQELAKRDAAFAGRVEAAVRAARDGRRL